MKEREKKDFFWCVPASQMCSDPVASTFSLMWCSEMYLYPSLTYYAAISLLPSNMRLQRITLMLKLKKDRKECNYDELSRKKRLFEEPCSH